ncbi:hypothetical protein ACH5RR_005273 [Cinchona calisaya]|uniref:DUF3527 domain protein n=1 Tax=Cinchona calisaya TaxID=153742 RepID=A0ABD3AKP4_9GENT
MGHNLEFKRSSSQQQSTNAVKEKILSTRTHNSSKFQEKCVVLNSFGQPPTDHQRNYPRQRMDDDHVIQQKSPVTRQKQQHVSKRIKDDELVKHMSNLPSYLQQTEKQKNIQVKALNFGVLDWKRLEKWRSNEHMPARGQPKASSNGSSLDMDSKKSTRSKTCVSRKQPPADLHLKSSTKVKLFENVQQSQGKFKHIHDPQTASGSTILGQQNEFCQKVKSSSRSCAQINHDRGNKKDADQAAISKQEASSLDEIEHSKGYQNGNRRRTGDNDSNDFQKCSNAEPQNIVLLMPRCPSKKSSSRNSESSESRSSSYGQWAKDARNKYSDCFSSQELQYGEFCNKIPRSCQNGNSIKPQSSDVKCAKAKHCDVDGPLSLDSCKRTVFETAEQTESRTSSHGQLADCDLNRYSDSFSSQEVHCGELQFEIPYSCPLPASIAISQDKESDVCSYPFQSDTSTEPRFSGTTCSEARSCNLDDLVSVESFKRMDLDLTNQPASKGRHPSPKWRSSFSLGRLSRSFSFKESSAVPKLSSTPTAAIDDSKRDKASASGRRRPSPFRRLLDPLMKPKGAHYNEAVKTKGSLSAETFQVSEKNSSYGNLQPINTDKPLSNETNKASTFQALMQLTIKNGLPFFKFVVDNQNDILVAAVKQFPTPGKLNSTLTFSFYSVHEIKRKAGGWMHNGSKEKNCGLGYDIVGQMKISRSFHMNPDDCSDQSIVTESVLFDVSIAEGDKGSSEVLPNREIAAIVFMEPAAKCHDGGSKAGNTDKQKGFVGSSPGNTCDQGEKIFNSTTVILPHGFHSLPNSGAPSSLIQRWKSGGLCDCGGWDVGCKLKILTNHNKGSNLSIPPARSCSKMEHLNLFIQGREGKRSQRILSLAPFKDGFYSVEFNASVSFLEAFSICVAVITSQEMFDTNHLPDAKFSAEAKTGNDVKKNMVAIQGEFPAKYVSSPPPSPVGRI